MSMTRLVVLANSWKHSDWCIAGIALETGAWVRPVTDLDDGRVPKSAMRLDGYFPKLLDIIELPLAPTGPDYGFEKENRTLLPGPWRRHGNMRPQDLLAYARPADTLLHNDAPYVSLDVLQQKKRAEQTSLQLIAVDNFRARQARKRTTGDATWQGLFSAGGREQAIRITDPVFVGKLSAGYKPQSRCLLTMSLSMPYKPPDWGEDTPPACWKLIAGVIEAPGTQV